MLAKFDRIGPKAVGANFCAQARDFMNRGDLVSAYRTFLAATRVDDCCTEAWIQIGDALSAAGKPELALVCHRKALELEPSALQYLRIANALSAVLRYDEAEIHYRRSLLFDASLSKSWYGLAYIKYMLGNLDEARDFVDRALLLEPEIPDIQYLSALLELSRGNWERGFSAHYDARELIREGTNRPKDIPVWQGEDLAGKRLYLFSEQGFGDVILFLRFVRQLPECLLSFMVPMELRRLINYSFPNSTIDFRNAGTEIPKTDFCLSLASIPRRLIETGSNFSVESKPYLDAPTVIISKPSGCLKTVGVVWAGDPKHPNDKWRSIQPEDFVISLSRPHVALYSLQIGGGEVDSSLLGDMGLMSNLGANITDFFDTAAYIKSLDVVVSVDTAVANLCGALGKTCHVLIPYGGVDWRWMHVGDRTPWYPTVVIHRQLQGQSWRDVLSGIPL